MDFYELLNLPFDASPKEVERAYLRAVATYHQEALASYGVLSAAERRLILERIEAAFLTLSDPSRRKAYDEMIFPSRPEFRQKAYFRKSTGKLEIEDALENGSFWAKAKSFFRKWTKNGQKTEEMSSSPDLELDAQSPTYGERLKMVRENRGLSREDIAATCGLSPAVLQALEEKNYAALPRGKDPSSLLQLYARTLGLSSENGRQNLPPRQLKRT